MGVEGEVGIPGGVEGVGGFGVGVGWGMGRGRMGWSRPGMRWPGRMGRRWIVCGGIWVGLIGGGSWVSGVGNQVASVKAEY